MEPRAIQFIITVITKKSISAKEKITALKNLFDENIETMEGANFSYLLNRLSAIKKQYNVENKEFNSVVYQNFLKFYKQTKTQECANVLNACVHLKIGRDEEYEALFVHFLKNSHAAKAQECANVLNACVHLLVSLFGKGGPRGILRKEDTKTILQRFLDILPTANTQECANVLNACMHLEIGNAEQYAKIFLRFMEELKNANAQAFANVLDACVQLDILITAEQIDAVLHYYQQHVAANLATLQILWATAYLSPLKLNQSWLLNALEDLLQQTSIANYPLQQQCQFWQILQQLKIYQINFQNSEKWIKTIEQSLPIDISTSGDKEKFLFEKYLQSYLPGVTAHFKKSIGAFELDVLIITTDGQQFNIEFDSPFHYPHGHLRLKDQCRDTILLNNYQISVIRLTQDELKVCDIVQMKLEPLLSILKQRKEPEITPLPVIESAIEKAEALNPCNIVSTPLPEKMPRDKIKKYVKTLIKEAIPANTPIENIDKIAATTLLVETFQKMEITSRLPQEKNEAIKHIIKNSIYRPWSGFFCCRNYRLHLLYEGKAANTINPDAITEIFTTTAKHR